MGSSVGRGEQCRPAGCRRLQADTPARRAVGLEPPPAGAVEVQFLHAVSGCPLRGSVRDAGNNQLDGANRNVVAWTGKSDIVRITVQVEGSQ